MHLYTFLTSTLDGAEWSVSLPCRFALECPLSRKLCGPTDCLYILEKKKFLACGESNPGLPGREQCM